MDRRTYLKSTLVAGGYLLMPTGVLALVGCSGTAPSPELASFDGQIMGTGYSVKLGGALPEGLSQDVHRVLQDIDAHMSTWRADSELTALNNSADTDWQSMSPATSEVIAHALDTSNRSAGAFDVTVGPLVDIWGFGAGSSSRATPDSGSRPSAQMISQTMASVGHDSIEVDLTRLAVRKRHPDTRLDLSGIAKGHAVDRVADWLDAQSIDSYLVEVGGELRSRGRKPDGSAWRVAIERPEVGRRNVFKVVELADSAIATSGDYRNFFDQGGQRFSHSIDPRTGRPVDHELASVSVVAESTMAADALSTALMIMGPDEAMAFAEQHQVAAHLILKSGTALADRQSSAFSALTS